MTTTAISPIQTQYQGYRFRNRLEARWAVLLDALGETWDYEDEGFNLSHSGRYLPDFLTTLKSTNFEGKVWIEVKGSHPTAEEINKLRELCSVTGKYGAFAVGSRSIQSLLDGTFGLTILGCHGLTHVQYPVKRFHPCGSSLKDWPDSEREAHFKDFDQLIFSDPLAEVPCKPFQRAAQAAFSARFVHGECGG